MSAHSRSRPGYQWPVIDLETIKRHRGFRLQWLRYAVIARRGLAAARTHGEREHMLFWLQSIQCRFMLGYLGRSFRRAIVDERWIRADDLMMAIYATRERRDVLDVALIELRRQRQQAAV